MKAKIELSVPVVIFKDEEEKVWYAHCPALDITGYGKSEEEASASFEVMLRESLEYMMSHGTLDKELQRLGWRMKGRPTPPPMETLLRDNEDLRRMMSLQHTLTYSAVPAIQ